VLSSKTLIFLVGIKFLSAKLPCFILRIFHFVRTEYTQTTGPKNNSTGELKWMPSVSSGMERNKL